jgi:hypothetical protein
VTASDSEKVISTVLNGRSGPMVILGKTYNGNMPVWRDQLSNPEVAAVVSYIRSAWAQRRLDLRCEMRDVSPVVGTRQCDLPAARRQSGRRRGGSQRPDFDDRQRPHRPADR